MTNLFHYDNKFMRALSKTADSVILGVLWLVCSLPVITLGASSVSFYYAYNKSIRQETGYAWEEFFRSFKANFKAATLSWLVLVVLAVLGSFNCFVLVTIGGTFPLSGLLLAIMLLVLIAITLLVLLLFPYIARYDNTWKDSIKNSFLILLCNFLWAVLLLIILLAVTLIAVWIPFLSIFMPAVYMFFANKILEHVFQKYMQPDDLQAQQELENTDA